MGEEIISTIVGMEEKKELLLPKKLRCYVQNYDWGRIGEKSHVAKLFSLNSGSDIDLNKPYAEFWMGTHDSGPSFISSSSSDENSITLKSWVSENPKVLGDKVIQKWGFDLPFLFKVLSVSKALSIQAHPDKELAKLLHEKNPSCYKDDNHKPEMALALTEFEALCGFVSLQELHGVFHSVPEIVELVSDADVKQLLSVNEEDGDEKVKPILRSIFTQLMSAGKDAVSETVSKLKERLTMENKVRELTEKEELILRLEKQYPSDIGVISAFFFNYVKLNPREALYLDANEPHAYIYGECIECMATSDNVVRAGLTPKYRDVSTLCSMLTYKQGIPEILRGVPLNPYTKRYTPPFDEFEVDSCILPRGESVVFPSVPGPSIFVITEGEGRMETSFGSDIDEIKEGLVVFVPAEIEINITASAETGLQLYRAGVNKRFFL